MMVPKIIRVLVHEYRCRRWLRSIKQPGVRAMAFQKDYLRSEHWKNTGRYLSDEEVETKLWRSLSNTLLEKR